MSNIKNFLDLATNFISKTPRNKKVDNTVMQMIEVEKFEDVLELINNSYILTDEMIEKIVKKHSLNRNDLSLKIEPIFDHIRTKSDCYESFFTKEFNNIEKFLVPGNLKYTLYKDFISYKIERKRSKDLTYDEVLPNLIYAGNIVLVFAKEVLKNNLNKTMFLIEKIEEQKNIVQNSCLDYECQFSMKDERSENHVKRYTIISQFLNAHYENIKHDNINNIKEILNSKQYVASVEEKALKIFIDNLKSTKQELPKKAIDLMEKINNNYLNYKDKIQDHQDLFIFKKMYEERVPEIIKEFLFIDSQSREKIKNQQNKNAVDLLISALQQVDENYIIIIEKSKKEIAENGLQQLNIHNRYLKDMI